MGWELPAAGGGGKVKPPVGNHLAACVAIIDMGDQEQDDKKTGRAYWSHRAFFVWELLTEQIAGTTKNHVIGADLTLTVADTGKLYKWIKARSGVGIAAGFNPLSELGQPCMLNVTANQGGHTNVDGMAAVPAVFAKSVPKPTYPLTGISLEEYKGGAAIPDWVPWCYGNPIDAYIKASREMGGKLGVSRASLRKKSDAPAAGASHAEGDGAKTGDPIPF